MKCFSIRALVNGAAALALAACGGGDGGIGGTGVTPLDVSVGTITAFGSVWVNGVEFSSNGAVIKRDDNIVTQAELRVGMVARVDGKIADKTAKTITVDSAAKGRVEATPTATQMVVMGQNITLSGSTRFESTSRPALGDYVEVHGQVVSDGTISAGFVEQKAFVPQFAVKGFVKGHVAGGTTFMIGTLNVTLGNGAIVGDMPAGSWNGLKVEVKGTACTGNPVCGTLTASKVEPEDLQGDIAEVELEAFVTAINVDGFDLGAQRVVTNGSTVYEGGVASDVLVGTEVEVEGSLSAGVLTAKKVSFRENTRLEGNAATVNVAAGTLTLAGLNGITIEANAQTRISGFADLAAIMPGSHIEVRGRPTASNGVVASEIKSGGGNTSRVILQAVAGAVADPNVTLLGIVVDTTPMTSANQFLDANGNPIGRAAFFAAAAPGTLIKARGTPGGAGVSWNDEIELED